jgi:hypothetical protein
MECVDEEEVREVAPTPEGAKLSIRLSFDCCAYIIDEESWKHNEQFDSCVESE